MERHTETEFKRITFHFKNPIFFVKWRTNVGSRLKFLQLFIVHENILQLLYAPGKNKREVPVRILRLLDWALR